MKTAVITGVTGQDGAYLARLLVEKGYRVVGIVRSLAGADMKGLRHVGVADRVKFEECDLTDVPHVMDFLEEYKPDELYNLAAQSSVGISFDQPLGTIRYNVLSVVSLLESIRHVSSSTRFYQASSSEMFGQADVLPITEKTVMRPVSPYGISKASAHWTTALYRESYGLFTCCGILFNHESCLRREGFFVRKVIRESVEIANGKRSCLRVGNIDVRRDFGYAPVYVKAMWKMLQADKADDYVICTGKSTSLREIIHHVFDRLGVPREAIVIDESLYRRTELADVCGCADKARCVLGWDEELDVFAMLDVLLDECASEYSRGDGECGEAET